MFEFEIPSDFSDCNDDAIRSCIEEAKREFSALNDSDDLSDSALDRMTALADFIESAYSEIDSRVEATTNRKSSLAKRFKQALFGDRVTTLQTEEEEGDPEKTEDGVKFPKEAYAYTPTDNVSDWKLRLWATPDGGPDARIVGAAVAALGKGFRGNKVQIPEDAIPGVKARVRAAWLAADTDRREEDIPEVIQATTIDVVTAAGARLDIEGYVPNENLPEAHVEAMTSLAQNLVNLANEVISAHYHLEGEETDADAVAACGELRHGDDVDEFEMQDFDMMFEPIEGADREFLEGLLPHHDAILQMIAGTEFKNVRVAKFAGMLAKKLVKSSAKIRHKLEKTDEIMDAIVEAEETTTPAPTEVVEEEG